MSVPSQFLQQRPRRDNSFRHQIYFAIAFSNLALFLQIQRLNEDQIEHFPGPNMNWYYADQGQPAGPVNDAQFEELVRSGKIQPDTLVWHEGMAAWQSYREVTSPSPPSAPAPLGSAGYAPGQSAEAVCAECGKLFAVQDMIRHGSIHICANCKPVFLQKLAEGARLNTRELNYAGFWIRLVAKLVDGLALTVVLVIPFIVLVAVFAASAATHPLRTTFHLDFSPHAPADVAGLVANLFGLFFQCGFVLVQVIYSTFFLGKYGATLGKMACGLKVVDAEGNKITYSRALGRGFAELLSGMICDIGYLIVAFDNPQKRALHDHICNTRVVYK